MRVVVLRTYLLMKSASEARPSYPDIPGLEMRPAGPSDAAAYRETFQEIGREVLWVDRWNWNVEEFAELLGRSSVRAWLAWLDGVPAGLVELVIKDDGSVQLTYMGARPRFQGRGLGKYLISYLIDRAWDLKPNRVWGYTHTLDSKYALTNEVKRGLGIWKRRPTVVDVPDSLAPKVRELLASARARGVAPGFLRRLEAHLRQSLAGTFARNLVHKLKQAAGAGGRPSRD